MLPLLVACGITYYAFKKKGSDYRVLLVALIGGFVVSYIIVSQVTRAIYMTGPAEIPTGADGQNYNALPLAQRLYDDITEWIGFRDDSPYKEALTLSDGQLIALHNAWNKNFYGRVGGKTLYQAIEGENGGWFLDFATIREQLLDRLQRLGL